MKRYVLFAGACLLGSLLSLRAQDPLAEAARREEAEQRYRELQTRLTQLEEAIQTYQKRMNAMSEELRSLRDQVERLSRGQGGTAGTEEVGRLQKAIEEVDRKRMEDNEKILAQLSRLREALTGKAAAPPRSKPSAAASATEKGYEYTVRKGDNFTRILAALREQGITVTQKQIEEANPGVKSDKLQIGQKIFIPAPPP
jgi:chromosome segregation ATPase